jgi:ATP-dependent DNA helicase RecG
LSELFRCQVILLTFGVDKYEKAGSGTQAMIELCRKAGLPEPRFEQRAGSFVITLWRDWLTAEVMDRLDLNERQRQSVLILKTRGQIGNKDYQEMFAVCKPIASRDLDELVRKGVLEKVGTTGKGTHYVFDRKGLMKGSKGSRKKRMPYELKVDKDRESAVNAPPAGRRE